jgi:hypothetical protein
MKVTGGMVSDKINTGFYDVGKSTLKVSRLGEPQDLAVQN